MRVLDEAKGLKDVSRRGVLKGTVALGAASMLVGCGSDSSDEVISVGGGSEPMPPAITETEMFGTTGHNCGGRCLTKAYVRNGVITRFVTDERPDIKILDGDDMQYRACSRCRSYKGRLYHTGRLRYPMIQKGNRGDMATFERVTWDVALQTIAEKMKSIRDTYGPQGFFFNHASGSILWNHGSGMMSNLVNAYGGSLGSTNNYSSHQRNYMRNMNGARFRTSRGSIIQTENIILWGSHFSATRNSRHWPMMQAKEEVNRKGGRIIYIGPSMEDTNASYANEWVPIRPGTDGALALAIMYEMMEGGKLKEDFVKKAVYGFYPCKSYWVDRVTGVTVPADPFAATVNQDPTDVSYDGVGNWSYIEEVPAGESLSDYLRGTTYTVVSGTNTAKYPYKQHVKSPKNAAWASAITGIDAETIKDLANIYGGSQKVFTERSYGVQRNYGGIYIYHAIDTLIAASGQWGRPGTGLDYYSKSFDYNTYNPGFPGVGSNMPGGLATSTTLWHEVARGAPRFADKDGALKNGCYKLIFNPADNTFAMNNGKHVVDLDVNSQPIKVTPKMFFNFAGNTLLNQHMNLPEVKKWITDRSLDSVVTS